MTSRDLQATVGQALGQLRRHWGLFLSLHVIASLIVALLLGPLLSLLIEWLVQATGDVALTDEDILTAFLSPMGFVLGIVGLALWLTVTVFETAAVLLAASRLRGGGKPRLLAVFASLGLRLKGTFRLAAAMTLRLVLVASPFLAIGGWIFLSHLTEFDINFYLAERPPIFWKAGAAIAGVLLIGAALLFRMVLGWVLALPLLLLDGAPAAGVLATSRRLMAPHRGRAARFLFAWGLVFLALFALSGALLQLSAGVAVEVLTGSLRSLAWVSAGLIGLWSVTNLFIGLLASLSFAWAVLAAFEAWGPEVDEAVLQRRARLDAAPIQGRRLGWLLAAAVLVLVGEFWLVGKQILSPGSVERPEIHAHRGASFRAPENTLAAIEEAIRQGADWVEIDVQETRDGRILVIHDRDLMKVGGSPLRVWDAPFDELRAVDIGSYRDPRYADERVPLLSEVLDLAKGRIKLNIELKVYGQEENLEALVAGIVEKHGMENDAVFMSLSLPVVRKLKALRPDWRVGLLSSVAVGDITRLDADFFAINARFASRSFVDRAQGRGKGVLTWTVNDPAGMSAMMGKGVDGIITDRPGLALRVWEERQDLAPYQRFLVQLASRLGSDYAEAP
ncbi:MAG: glycerophosphodiester phosphodiesterase [Xanthomonadales bacterium]|nr:glycerophosphodiester phosphodiesterase [Xanthomonadales bacterium]